MKSILSVVRKSIAVIGAVAMMITLMTAIIPTQPAYAELVAPSSQAVESQAVESAGVGAVAGKVAIKLAAGVIGNMLSESGNRGTQYLMIVQNESQFPVTFQGTCQWGNGYWPLLSQPIEPGEASFGTSASSQFQYAGVYRTAIPNSSVQNSLVFGAFRRQPIVGSSIKRDLIDSVVSLDCGRYSNVNNLPWRDSRTDDVTRDVQTTPPLRLVVRHLKRRYPPATNDVTVYEFRITNG